MKAFGTLNSLDRAVAVADTILQQALSTAPVAWAYPPGATLMRLTANVPALACLTSTNVTSAGASSVASTTGGTQVLPPNLPLQFQVDATLTAGSAQASSAGSAGYLSIEFYKR